MSNDTKIQELIILGLNVVAISILFLSPDKESD